MRNHQTIGFWRGRLPHWEVVDGSYFVTLRLAGTLPSVLKRELSEVLEHVQSEEYQEKARIYFRKMEAWLDHHLELDALIDPPVAEMIMAAFGEYESRGVWKMHSFVIMPNHLHCFFTPQGRNLAEIIRNFKRFTARKANTHLGTPGKRFWQQEWFDHWTRSAREEDRIVQYIRNNPYKAGLVKAGEQWPYMC